MDSRGAGHGSGVGARPESPLLWSPTVGNRGWQSTGSMRLPLPLPPVPSPGVSPGANGQPDGGDLSSVQTDPAAGVHEINEALGNRERQGGRGRRRPPHIQHPILSTPQELQAKDLETLEITLDPGAHRSETSPLYQKVQENWEKLTTDLIHRWMSNGGKGRKITINASGMVCTSYETFLRRFPGTLLSDMVRDAGGDLHKKSVLFIDRHPFATCEIVNCYRDGFLPVKPPHIPFEVWQNELLYFRMHKCSSKIPGLEAFMRLYSESEASKIDRCRPPDGTLQLKVYELLEVPKSSRAAWLISSMSMAMVGFSVATVCAETVTVCSESAACVEWMEKSDLAVVTIFTIEYLLRLLVTANKKMFLLNFLNIVDFLSILPTWLALLASDNSGVEDTADVLRVLRILRVFKLARQYTGLQVLFNTAVAARAELGQVTFCFSILVVLFAAIVFYSEENVEVPHDEPFRSIPQTMWWAIITLCTVGYGDLVPLSPAGKLFGSMCCVAGVVVVALPISVISSTFQDQYQEHIENEKIEEGRRRIAKEREEKIKQMKKRKNSMGTVDSESFFSLLFLSKKSMGKSVALSPSPPLSGTVSPPLSGTVSPSLSGTVGDTDMPPCLQAQPRPR